MRPSKEQRLKDLVSAGDKDEAKRTLKTMRKHDRRNIMKSLIKYHDIYREKGIFQLLLFIIDNF